MKKKIKKAVIPAAGLGTRTLPASKAIPKELVPLFDKPSIQYIVEEAVNSGIEEIIIVTGRGKAAIEDHFDKSYELEKTLEEKGKIDLLNKMKEISSMAKFTYVRQAEPKGLGHAVLTAKHAVGDEPFAVLLPDDLIENPVPGIKQLIDVSIEFNKPTVSLLWVPDELTNLYGMVKLEKVRERVYKVWDMIEKPPLGTAPSNYAIIGRYVFWPDVFEAIENQKPGALGEIQLTDAIRTLADTVGVLGVEFEGKRFDAGDKFGALEATLYYAAQDPKVAPKLKELFDQALKWIK